MSVGGFIAGIAVALVAGWVSRRTPLKEDASFAGFYLGSLAWRHAGLAARLSVDLLHLLFGSILAVDSDAAFFVTGVASLTLLCIALFYRGLVSEAFDSAATGQRAAATGAAARPVSCALGTEHGGGVSGARHANGGRADDVARGSALLGADAAGHFVAGGGDRRVLRTDGIEPFVGSEFTRRARHRADRQRTVFISVFLARAAGWSLAGAN